MKGYILLSLYLLFFNKGGAISMSTYNYNPYAYYYNNMTPVPTSAQVQPYNVLNGRLVENMDIAKTAEVPVGSYGVFPKSDLSEVYIKTWNPNGTTNILTYRLAEGQQPASSDDNFAQINSKLAELSDKIDALTAARREVRASDY